jgi:hypothetical protein
MGIDDRKPYMKEEIILLSSAGRILTLRRIAYAVLPNTSAVDEKVHG